MNNLPYDEYSAALSEQFPPHKIKQTQQDGKIFDTIPVWEAIHRLNQVYGTRWSCYQVDQNVYGSPPEYIEIRVCIEVPDPTDPSRTWKKEGWGGHEFNGKTIDVVVKTAYSRALTKAASMLGVGLYLYGTDSTSAPAQAQQVTVVNPGPHNQVPQGANVRTTQPQMGNPNVPPQTLPRPAPQQQPEAPYPNFQPGQNFVDTSQADAVSSGQAPGSAAQPVQAKLGIQSAGQGQESGVAEFQLNAIRGLATAQQVQDIMQIVHQALGQEAQNIQALEQLTSTQAIRVMEFLRSQVAQ